MSQFPASPASPVQASASSSPSQSQMPHTPEATTSYSPQQPHPQPYRPYISKRQFCLELSHSLADFVVQLLPTQEELAVKEDVRKLLERLIRTVEQDSRLLSFGSTANGFSLRNSDMDLCCLIDAKERRDATTLVQLTGDLLERETKFQVKPLPHARIPIVKLSLNPSPGLPFGISCDIGFENRLALENTRLLMSYAAIDPLRVRTMVLFCSCRHYFEHQWDTNHVNLEVKVWSKRRKINSPYRGTLSSYGYVLLVLYFLVHVKNPPVLPNLQQIPPMRPISHDEIHLNGRNIWFFDDIQLLRQRWISANDESVAELLIDFFHYYSRDFTYNTGVASIRAGLVRKESKGWAHESDPTGTRYTELGQTRNKLCIEDPFETDFNVARSVTREGLYVIRGEFMRAHRLLLQRNEKSVITIAQLCEEREDDLPIPQTTPLFTGPALAPIPAQTPYSVGSGSQNLRSREGEKERDRLSPPQSFLTGDQPHSEELPQPLLPISPVSEAGPSSSSNGEHNRVSAGALPDHMAPIRSKWTSPPPPDSDAADLTSFDDRFVHGLEMATMSSAAREPSMNPASHYASSEVSEPSSDIETNPDEDALSDVGFVDSRSVASFNGLEAPRSRPTTLFTNGTRTPPMQTGHIIPVPATVPLPFLQHHTAYSHLPPRHQPHPNARPNRLYQSRPAPSFGNSSRTTSDTEQESVLNVRQTSRDDSSHPMRGSAANHDRGTRSTSTPRPHVPPSMGTGYQGASNGPYSHPRLPPRVQNQAYRGYIPPIVTSSTMQPLPPYAYHTVMSASATQLGGIAGPTAQSANFSRGEIRGPEAACASTPSSPRPVASANSLASSSRSLADLPTPTDLSVGVYGEVPQQTRLGDSPFNISATETMNRSPRLSYSSSVTSRRKHNQHGSPSPAPLPPRMSTFAHQSTYSQLTSSSSGAGLSFPPVDPTNTPTRLLSAPVWVQRPMNGPPISAAATSTIISRSSETRPAR